MPSRTLLLCLTALAPAATALPVEARVGPPHTCCYIDGVVYRTVAPPASTPNEGHDNLYAILGGVEGQLPVAASAPGDTDYDGGFWAVHSAAWGEGVEPYLPLSEEDVLAAPATGDLTVMCHPDRDFRCPLQP